MFKSGYVSIIGETNAGKSTILNRIMKEKVSVVSPKVQTTRKNIKGIYNREDAQIIFIDTPGIHKKNSKLSTVMIDSAIGSIKDADVILFVAAGNKKELSAFDEKILEELSKSNNKKVIAVINKIDRITKEIIMEKIDMLKDLYDFEAIVPVSGNTGEGLDDLENVILDNLEEGPKYFADDEYTDQTVKEMSEEIIRSKLLKLLRDEIPHGINVEIETFKEGVTKEGEPIHYISATIYTKKSSHKGMIIGKNGEMLKRIGTYSREDLERFLDTKVNLRTWVKVRNNWIDDDKFIKQFKDKK